jgi:polyphosphate kinase 2 (PPK2 family)
MHRITTRRCGASAIDRSINDLEKHLNVNGTGVVKVFLHLSKEEQRKRFLEHIEDPRKTGNSATQM